jgi:hypothetical protein
MVNRLSPTELHQLQDNILANHFSDIKYIQAFNNRHIDYERFLFNDRFCLKNFLQEFNIIRHVCKDADGVESEARNIVRLSNRLKEVSFQPEEIDEFAKSLKHDGISKVNPVSLSSKMFFLGNPERIYIYDSLVRTAIGLKNISVTYSNFLDRIETIVLNPSMQAYIDEIERSLTQRLILLESWTGIGNASQIRRMRLVDRYLMFLGERNISLYKKKPRDYYINYLV